MSGAVVLKYVGIPSALVACTVLFPTARAFLISDPPPYASIERVDTTNKRLEAVVVRGNLIGRWSSWCEAMRSGNQEVARVQNLAIGDLQDEYFKLTDGYYQLRPC